MHKGILRPVPKGSSCRSCPTGASSPAVRTKTWAWSRTSSRGLRIPNKSNTGSYSVSKNDDAYEFMYYFIIYSIISLRTELRSQRTILENISSHLGTRPISNQQISLLHELLDWEFFKRWTASAITQAYLRMHGIWVQCGSWRAAEDDVVVCKNWKLSKSCNKNKIDNSQIKLSTIKRSKS